MERGQEEVSEAGNENSLLLNHFCRISPCLKSTSLQATRVPDLVKQET